MIEEHHLRGRPGLHRAVAVGALALLSACSRRDESSTVSSRSPVPEAATQAAADGRISAAVAAPAPVEPVEAPAPPVAVLPPRGHRFSDVAVAIAREGGALVFRTEGGRACRLAIATIQYVKIHTTSEGPTYDDLFWELGGPQGVCVVDGASPDIKVLMRALDEFADDPDASRVIVEASGSTDDRTFDVWQRRGRHRGP